MFSETSEGPVSTRFSFSRSYHRNSGVAGSFLQKKIEGNKIKDAEPILGATVSLYLLSVSLSRMHR